MGEQDVREQSQRDEIRVFLKHLLKDVRALEQMLERRAASSPACGGSAPSRSCSWSTQTGGRRRSPPRCSQTVDDPHFTTELGPLQPRVQPRSADLRRQLPAATWSGRSTSCSAKVRDGGPRCGGEVVLTGILPTLNKSDLELANMTPNPRYFALNEAMTRLRGGDYEFFLKGLDELHLHHDSIMVEACNTSFQVHFQVAPEEFARLYNAAQAVTGAGARGGRQLADAVRQAAVVGDPGRAVPAVDRHPAVHPSPARADPAGQLRPPLGRGPRCSRSSGRTSPASGPCCPPRSTTIPFEALERGEAPSLKALRLHNSTVYRWNRVCYGISDGKPHLRIENRILPSGPDGARRGRQRGLLVRAGQRSARRVRRHHPALQLRRRPDQLLRRRPARAERPAVLDRRPARTGRPADPRHAAPAGPRGPRRLRGIDAGDIDRYLGTIEERVRSGRTGAQWQLVVDGRDGPQGTAVGAAERRHRRHRTAASRPGEPVHTWEPARLDEGGGWKQNYLTVEQCMDTDLVTVRRGRAGRPGGQPDGLEQHPPRAGGGCRSPPGGDGVAARAAAAGRDLPPGAAGRSDAGLAR